MLIYCESRDQARHEKARLKAEVKNKKITPFIYSESLDRDVSIKSVGHIMDAGKGKVFSGSKDWVEGGCRWAVKIYV